MRRRYIFISFLTISLASFGLFGYLSVEIYRGENNVGQGAKQLKEGYGELRYGEKRIAKGSGRGRAGSLAASGW